MYKILKWGGFALMMAAIAGATIKFYWTAGVIVACGSIGAALYGCITMMEEEMNEEGQIQKTDGADD